jgi:eukaryotic-like serine/threonine-protein kinase
LAAAWDLKRAATFFSLLADGLQELKANNLVHRDLKPSNIRVQTNGQPVIIDLGYVRHLTMPDLTGTGVGVGTPLYFAPEQWEGRKRDIDHRTDLFAFGILLYQALTGSHPFYRAGMTTSAQLQQAACAGNDHLTASVFTALPNNWQLLLKKLLGRQVHERPSDAAQVAAILRKLGGAP